MTSICDNCLTAAADEVVMLSPEAAEDRALLEQICINQGADIADHSCLEVEGYADRCDCACHRH